jgi:hypothetical protein
MQHSLIDQRSLELDRVVIRRLREDPALVDMAKGTLRRWLSNCSINVRPDLLRWQQLLDGDFEVLLQFLASDASEATRLRQSSPFAGPAFITGEERDEIFRRYQHSAAELRS